MFGMRYDNFRSQFFDRPVTQAVDRATRRVLSRFGAFVRTRAQSLMLGHQARRISVRSKITNREGISPPGQPPTPHLGFLVTFMFFAFDAARKSVVIGPAKIGGRIGNAPQALEEGGVSQAIIKRQGQRVLVSANVRKYPFMKPALDMELPKLAGMWKDQVRP